MVKVKIKTFKDLVEVFPTMTDSQIMKLYLEALRRIKHYNDMIPENVEPFVKNEKVDFCLEQISYYHEFTDYLGGYLARRFCDLHGFKVDA